MGAISRIKHAWNAFLDRDEDDQLGFDVGPTYGRRPDRVRMFVSNERSIIASIYTRIAIDVASVDIRHVRLDDEQRYLEEINSELNNCLTLEANLDQISPHLIQDVAMQMFNNHDGNVAIVPIDTTINPDISGGYDIKSLRAGPILEWAPQKVKVDLYNEKTGRREQIWIPKKVAAIVENPFSAVMNETNSTLQRIIRKLTLLDTVDNASASGKLDLLIQLPYVIKNEAKQQQAEQRRRNIEVQLTDTKYGIAYIDATEKVTQLNRPAENNLMGQVEYLMKVLYGQLGLTEGVMNGTAEEAEMLNYRDRTLDPILTAIVLNMKRAFLTKTARSQRQSIEYFIDPFNLVPMTVLAEIADKLTRNEILSSNEFRQILGRKPSKDPKADQLRNSNMPESELGPTEGGEAQQGALDGIQNAVDEIFNGLGVDLDSS